MGTDLPPPAPVSPRHGDGMASAVSVMDCHCSLPDPQVVDAEVAYQTGETISTPATRPLDPVRGRENQEPEEPNLDSLGTLPSGTPEPTDKYDRQVLLRVSMPQDIAATEVEEEASEPNLERATRVENKCGTAASAFPHPLDGTPRGEAADSDDDHATGYATIGADPG